MRGVEAMQDHQYIDDRDLDLHSNDDNAPQEKKPFLFFADNSFGSIKAVSEICKLGHHACFNIKNGHSRVPRAFLEEQIKDFPGGIWIVLKGCAEKEAVDLVCIGYKYNKKKVLIFVMTKGAGSTNPGEPYVARFPDKFGNVCPREVGRPEILSNYFKYSNCVDLHNQAHQFDLSLEKWVTQNAYFCLYTSILRVVVVDAWKALKLSDSKTLLVREFADVLAQQLLGEAEDLEEKQVGNTIVPENVVTCTFKSSTTVSSLSIVKPCNSHTKVLLKKGKQLRCLWCSCVNLVECKSTLKCLECRKGFCCDKNNGLSCWSHHVALGGISAAPKHGTKKMKLCDVLDTA